MEKAPKNNLPSWSECNVRMHNTKYLEELGKVKDGKILDPMCADSLICDPLHEFIYEYDDADPYKSEWFMHRLEKLIEFVKQQARDEING